MTIEKKEVVYTITLDNEEGYKEAEKLQSELYEKYNEVNIYPQGSWGVLIKASDPITAR